MPLYVYYRLAPERATAARAAFESARGTAPVQLLQREPPDESLTWMEIYPAEAQDLEPAIAAALGPLIAGPRHLEAFEPLA